MYLFDTWIPGSIVFWGALVLIVLTIRSRRWVRLSFHMMLD